MWIKRDLEMVLSDEKDWIQVLRGPRQTGKSSLFLKIDEKFKYLTLDDFNLKELANDDPELFVKQFFTESILIHEIQYAPNLFPALKRIVDLYRQKDSNSRKTIIRLTGSNQILLDRNVKESLSGRAAYYDLNTLSVHEILNFKDQTIQEIIFKGGWPEIYRYPEINVKNYLDNYINTYIEKDIILTANIDKKYEFLKFVKLLASRVSQILDYSSLANECGVDQKTIKTWIYYLEQMKIIYLLQPYFSNLSSRLVKKPKVYFLDTGLVCRLQGWTFSDPMNLFSQQGFLFENLVFSEIYKTNINFKLGWNLYYWRSRSGEEVDFLIEIKKDEYIFVESKVSRIKIPEYKKFPEIKKVFKEKIPDYFLCYQEGENMVKPFIPIRFLSEFLRSF